MRRFLLLPLVVLVLVALASCGGGYGSPAQPTPAKTAAAGQTIAPPPASGAAEVKVSIKGFAFVPAEVMMVKGTKVTWTNEDSTPHTATGKDFDSGTLNKGQSWSKTFDTEGTHEYICTLHPSMKGKVVVK